MPNAIRDAIESTSFVDTHEHLLEEGTRLRGPGENPRVPCDDAALLFHHYARDDLHAAGMPPAEQQRFFAPDIDPGEKWRRFAPYWQRCRHTGYMQAVARTFAVLFEEPEADEAAFARVSAQMRAQARPGFYRTVFARAGVESCQVNSFEAICCASAQPDLLMQDLNLVPYTVELNLEALQRHSGIAATTLEAMEATVDWFFDRYAPVAVAAKSASAYARRLNYEDTPRNVADTLFTRHARGERLDPAERKALQDHLMRRALRLAGEHGLPVKLHCGYYAGNDRMPLERVRQNAADLCPVLAAFPDTTFVLMHIGYPYQDEYIALAKHYANVHVDLCWAWIINPVATVRFVREFLLAAPASKLFTFGGDYGNVEPIVGHAAIARQGLALALESLVSDGWLVEHDALALVEPLMRGNARRVFKLADRSVSTLSAAG